MEFLDPSVIGNLPFLIGLGVVLLVVLLVLQMMFKLTRTLFRVGCGLIIFIVLAAAVLLYTR